MTYEQAVRIEPKTVEEAMEKAFWIYAGRGCLGAGLPETWKAVAEAAQTFGGGAELRDALESSVSLQSHYATLLNMHDGGKRMGFENADAWLQRIREIKGK